MQIKTLYKKDIHQGSLILVNQHYPFSFSHINLCFFQDTVHQIQMDASRLLHQCLNHLHIQDEIIVASAYRSALEQKQLYQESLKNMVRNLHKNMLQRLIIVNMKQVWLLIWHLIRVLLMRFVRIFLNRAFVKNFAMFVVILVL